MPGQSPASIHWGAIWKRPCAGKHTFERKFLFATISTVSKSEVPGYMEEIQILPHIMQPSQPLPEPQLWNVYQGGLGVLWITISLYYKSDRVVWCNWKITTVFILESPAQLHLKTVYVCKRFQTNVIDKEAANWQAESHLVTCSNSYFRKHTNQPPVKIKGPVIWHWTWQWPA